MFLEGTINDPHFSRKHIFYIVIIKLHVELTKNNFNNLINPEVNEKTDSYCSDTPFH